MCKSWRHSLSVAACCALLAAGVSTPAQAADEAAQVFMLRKVFSTTVDQWPELLAAEKKLLDDSFFERVEQRIRWSLENGQIDDAVRFSFVGDIASGITNRKSNYRLQMSQMFKRVGNNTMAMDLVTGVLMQDPTNQEARFYKATLMQEGGDMANCYPIYEELYKEGYLKAECLYRMATLELPREEVTLAKEHLEETLKLDPKHEGARKELDKINLIMANATFVPKKDSTTPSIPFGSMDTPQIMYDEVRASQLVGEGNRARLEDKFDKALSLYDSALKANPNSIEALKYMGTIYFRQQKYSEGVRSLVKAAALSPENADICRYLGYCYEGLYETSADPKDLTRAAECFDKALSLNPADEFIELDIKRIAQKNNL